MLQSFRSALKSKIGAGIAIAVLVVIAIAFTSGDVANTGGVGNFGGNDSVAVVGDERIEGAALIQAANAALDRARESNPTTSMKVLLASGGLTDVLDDLIDRLAIAVFGKDNGIVASDRLIDSEISQIAAFRGADGKFDENLFRQALQQQGLSEAMMRDDIAQGLIARQAMMPASVGATMPADMALRYATLLRERRMGSITVIPSLAFVERKEPTDKELSDFYAKSRDRFIRPERRVVRFATFGEEAIKQAAAPTEAEIAARYKANSAVYAASEKRSIVQLIVPTEAAAKAVVAEVSAGRSLQVAAREKGLAATTLTALSRAELGKQFSAQVAAAVFAAPQGKIAAPARSPLGWHVAQVSQVQTTPARTLDQVRGELTQAIALEKKRDALTDALEEIEDEFDSGGSLADAAKALGITIQTTPPVTADGNLYQMPGKTAPAVLAPVLKNAFTMESEEPQLAEVERGKTFIIYDVTDIAESAPAPLKEIRADVRTAFIMDKASKAAKVAAEKVRAQIAKGKTVQQALASLGKPMPPPQAISMSRPELSMMQQQQQQVPPPLAMLFSMAKGTAKMLPAEADRGWFVVSLDTIEPGKVARDDPFVAAARKELGTVAGSEYTDALGRAIRNAVGVKRNAAALRAVREQLGGSGS